MSETRPDATAQARQLAEQIAAACQCIEDYRHPVGPSDEAVKIIEATAAQAQKVAEAQPAAQEAELARLKVAEDAQFNLAYNRGQEIERLREEIATLRKQVAFFTEDDGGPGMPKQQPPGMCPWCGRALEKCKCRKP